ncbi:MAG: hypothetical protein HY541_04610 [Deltaproteobacteria bacterium]|nr:hypothetical protein [Deltaproteobacteria bacterium]
MKPTTPLAMLCALFVYSSTVFAFTLDEAKADAKACIEQKSNDQCKADLSAKYGPPTEDTASHLTWKSLPSDQPGQCIRIQLLKGTNTVQAGTPRMVPCP